jgi:diadenosine tetraphosphate (Ap4A) HIT family hydrolase
VSNDCNFCQKLDAIDQLSANELVCELPYSVVLLGPWQRYQGYCIVVSRSHVTELSQLDTRHLFLGEMCLVARAIETCFHPKKLNYELLGNQVPHLHWHVIPRYADDPDAANPIWFAVERAKTDDAERQRLMARPMSAEQTANVLREQLRLYQSPLSRG